MEKWVLNVSKMVNKMPGYVQILTGDFTTFYVFIMDECNNRTVNLSIGAMLMDMIWIVDFIQ